MKRAAAVLLICAVLSACGHSARVMPPQRSGAFPASPIRALTVIPNFASLGPRNLSPYGGSSGKLQAIAVLRSNPNVMYVAGGYGHGFEVFNDTGIYKTTNGGLSWTAVNAGLSDTIVNDIYLDQANPNVLLAATLLGGIFRSANAGISWSKVYNVNEAMQFAKLGSTLYAGTKTGIAASSNDGATWSQVEATASPVNALAAGPAFLVTGLQNGQTLVYANGVWTTKGTIQSGSAVHALVVDPSTPSTIFASINGYNAQNVVTQLLWRSTNSATTWSSVPLPSANMRGSQVLAYSPTVPHKLYVGGSGIVGSTQYFTTNNGGTFTAAAGYSDERGLTVLANGSGRDRCLIAGDQGLFSFTNCNIASSVSPALTRNLSLNYATSVAVHGSTIFAMLQDFSAYVSFDGGSTWQDTDAHGGNFVEDGWAAIDSGNPAYCFGYDRDGFEQSSDGCHTFRTTGAFISDYITNDAIAIDPSHANVVYATSTQGLMKSTNYGGTFSRVFSGDVNLVDVDPANGNHILVGVAPFGIFNGTKLYVTKNGGTTWTPTLSNDFGLFTLAIDPSNPNEVLAVDQDYNGVEVFRSVDGGSTFTHVATPVTSALRPLQFPIDPFRLELDRDWFLPLSRTQHGSTPLPQTPFYFPWPERVAFDPRSVNAYAALTTTDGTYVSTDVGTTWTRIDTNALSHIGYGLQWVNGTLYIATAGQGILKSTSPLQ